MQFKHLVLATLLATGSTFAVAQNGPSNLPTAAITGQQQSAAIKSLTAFLKSDASSDAKVNALADALTAYPALTEAILAASADAGLSNEQIAAAGQKALANLDATAAGGVLTGAINTIKQFISSTGSGSGGASPN